MHSYFITSLFCLLSLAGAPLPRCFKWHFSKCSGVCKPGLWILALQYSHNIKKIWFLKPYRNTHGYLPAIFSDSFIPVAFLGYSSYFQTLHLLNFLSLFSSFASFQNGLNKNSTWVEKSGASPKWSAVTILLSSLWFYLCYTGGLCMFSIYTSVCIALYVIKLIVLKFSLQSFYLWRKNLPKLST